MKEDPLKDDWIHLVKQDMKDMNINLSDELIEALSKYEFKILIKNKNKKLFILGTCHACRAK